MADWDLLPRWTETQAHSYGLKLMRLRAVWTISPLWVHLQGTFSHIGKVYLIKLQSKAQYCTHNWWLMYYSNPSSSTVSARLFCVCVCLCVSEWQTLCPLTAAWSYLLCRSDVGGPGEGRREGERGTDRLEVEVFVCVCVCLFNTHLSQCPSLLFLLLWCSEPFCDHQHDL